MSSEITKKTFFFNHVCESLNSSNPFMFKKKLIQGIKKKKSEKL